MTDSGLQQQPSERTIVADLADYLRENPGVCADVSIAAGNHPWIRYRDGEWQAAQFGKYGKIEGGVRDEETVVDLLAANPVNLEPVSEAYLLNRSSGTVWEHASEQDVFTDRDRCFWCGFSGRTKDLSRYETTEDGERLLCADCHDEWDDCDQIVAEEGASA